MTTKILIERVVQHGHEPQVLDLMKQLRALCLDQPGYIQSETLRDASNPSRLLVIIQWDELGHWRHWEASDARHRLTTEMRTHLEQDPAINVFLEGLSAETSGA